MHSFLKEEAYMKIRLFACMAAVAGLTAGCAPMSLMGESAVPEAKLRERAAFALGARPDAISISNISREGVRTNFVATVGKRSNLCYVTSVTTVTGFHVSDAICSGAGSGRGVTRTTGKGGTCNALLREAGRC